MSRAILILVAIGAMAALIGASGGAAFNGTPSGQRTFSKKNVLEPFYNAENAGEIGILMEPAGQHSPTKVNPKAWSPIYLPVYPVGSTAADTYLCKHLENGALYDNCPTHGLAIAGLAMGCPDAIPGCSQDVRDVYAGGVAGHDHVMDFPGGSDFNVAWEPIVVLFTSSQAANEHLLTDEQIENAVAAGDAIEIPLPDLTFNCVVVPERVWDLGTPFEPITG